MEVDIKPICAICLLLNVAKEYYDIVLLRVMRFKMFAFQNKRKVCNQNVALFSHYLVTDNDPSAQKCTKLRLE